MLMRMGIVLSVAVIMVFAWIVYGPADSGGDISQYAATFGAQEPLIYSAQNEPNVSVPQLPLIADNKAPLESSIATEQSSHQADSIPLQKQINSADALNTPHPRDLVDDYIIAWRNKDIDALKLLWQRITDCDACLAELRDMLVNGELEKGLVLELSNAIIAADNDIMLPVFNYLLNPVNDRTTSIIVSEQLIRNGSAKYVQKVFDAIQAAEADGMQQFAYQLSWVISKLKNVDGLEPVLDIIASKNQYTPEYSAHVSTILSKTMNSFEDQQALAEKVSDYFGRAAPQEQEFLWEVVKSQSDSLVMLANQAHQRGERYNVEKFTTAIADLQNVGAVDAIMKLPDSMDYPQEFYIKLARKSISDNPDTDTLRRYEDYLRDARQPQQKRVIAAEGLLAAKDRSKLANYILEKLMQYGGYDDADMQAYVSNRM